MKNYFLIFLCFLTSCGIFEDDLIVRNIEVSSVIINSTDHNNVDITAKTGWHNGCGRYSHFLYYLDGQTISIEVYGSQKKDAICTQQIIYFDAPVKFKTSQTGEVTIKFMYNGISTLDTTIILK